MNPQDEDTLYGLCDFGFGYPELGYVRLSELQNTIVPVPPAGIGLEWYLHFKPSHSLIAYAEAAQQNGAVTTPPSRWTRPKTAAKLPLKRIVENGRFVLIVSRIPNVGPTGCETSAPAMRDGWSRSYAEITAKVPAPM